MTKWFGLHKRNAESECAWGWTDVWKGRMWAEAERNKQKCPWKWWDTGSKSCNRYLIIIIIINSLTARVVGAPQIILQPFFSIFSVLHRPLGLAELQACPFPDVVFPPLPLSALSSSPFHCALQDGFGQTRWTGNMTIPLQFASLYDGQEVFAWSSCLLDLGTDFLVGNLVLPLTPWDDRAS